MIRGALYEDSDSDHPDHEQVDLWKTPALQRQKKRASARRKASESLTPATLSMSPTLPRKKTLIILAVLTMVLCSAGAVSAAFAFGVLGPSDAAVEAMATEDIRLEFEGDWEFTIKVGEEIPEPLVRVYIDGELSDRGYEVFGVVDNMNPGIYEVRYVLDIREIVSRVTVVDDVPPVIKLKGNKKTVLLEDEKYQESGYEASDNVDGDLTDQVVVSGEVKTAVGTYILTYSVEDSSGNKASAERTVVVNKKLVPQQAAMVEKKDPPKITTEVASNEITSMNFTSTGINVTAKYSENVESFALVNTETGHETTYKVNKSDSVYTGFLNLAELANGKYDLYLNNNKTTREKMVNKMEFIHRIARAKVGGKLVTVSYANNNVSVTLENHIYRYDIAIDVGHGGTDPGAINNYMYESNLNLEISLYERDRYVAHGLNVLLNRTGNALELSMGPADLVELHRRAYALGYYGAVSRFVYSNHHNSSLNTAVRGYEIIVPATHTATELAVEHAVANAWDKVFNLSGDSRNRFYTRHYDTDVYYSKRNGEVYTFNNWFGINRIPFNLFNVKASIYEDCYMSNAEEFDWYYKQGNWRKVSEAKIKAYVEALGKTYVPPSEDL
ncbi:MAG: DUF5011 domain-containing protein [Peptococcaceae bacterium]|nr:DUF5011 domain-containing protein [Peptococcaceae bacterium]